MCFADRLPNDSIVDEDGKIVRVEAVGYKPRERLLIEGKEVDL